MHHDWAQITTLAYSALLELNQKSFPIPADGIKCKGVRICSFQDYANFSKVSVSQLSLGDNLNDAYIVKNIRPGINLILFNAEIYPPRCRHSIFHEIGHFVCNHNKHGEQEEIDANFFASQVCAPNALIKAIAQRGYKINISCLMNGFGLSHESSQKKIDYFKRYPFVHSNEYDDLVLQQFGDFLNSTFPVITSHFYDDEFERREKERECWD